jgi:hypothetical protein
MTTLADVRPAGLDVLFRPGTTVTAVFTAGAGELDGRVFTSTLDAVALSAVVLGDTLTIVATAEQTAVHEVGVTASWELLEDLGGPTPEVVAQGTWTPSDSPQAVDTVALELALGTVTVTVELAGAQASIVELEETLVRPAWTLGAAADPPAEMLARADVVCTGTDDQVELEAALALGNVQLTEGTYSVNPMVEVPASDRWLRGSGPGTVIQTAAHVADDGPDNFGTIEIRGDVGDRLERVIVSDLVVDGNRAAITGTPPAVALDYGEGINWHDADDCHVWNVEVRNAYSDGFDFDDTDRCTASRITADGCGGYGVHISIGALRTRVTDATIRNGLGVGGRGGFDVNGDLDGGTRESSVIAGVRVEDCVGTAFRIDGEGSLVSGVSVRGGDGGIVTGTDNALTGFEIDGDGSASDQLTLSGTTCRVANGLVRGMVGPGRSMLVTGDACSITGVDLHDRPMRIDGVDGLVVGNLGVYVPEFVLPFLVADGAVGVVMDTLRVVGVLGPQFDADGTVLAALFVDALSPCVFNGDSIRVVGGNINMAPIVAGADVRLVGVTGAAGSSDARGTATILDGNTTVVATHGLYVTPVAAIATAQEVEAVAVSARDGDDITIERAGSSGDLDVDWSAWA